MTRHTQILAAFGLALSVAAGCAARDDAFKSDTAPTPPEKVDTVAAAGDVEKGDAAWAERTSPDKVKEAIGHWEKAVASNPGDWETMTKLIRAHYFLADGYLRGEDNADAYLETMDKGVSWGERALKAVSPEFAEAAKEKGKLYEKIKLVGKDGVPAMYWYAACLGKWARASSFADLVANKDMVKSTMDHVYSLDKSYYYAGADRYFGAYYAIAPKAFGGDLAKSKEHFEASLAAQPNFLGTKVLKADAYACHKKVEDEEMYEALLAEVIAADPKAIPEIEPEALVVQAKAKEMQGNFEDFCDR